MIRFSSDYSEGAHPSLLALLSQTNLEQNPGYGEDSHCLRAAELIRQKCAYPDAAVHFLTGGTQTNSIVIASVLRPYQGVLCAESGHIHVHETGAVESTGHKVLPLPAADGKITATLVSEACKQHIHDPNFEHTVQPGMVYLSHPTEYGTLYTLDELTALSKVCRQGGLPLFMDGARLGYGLAAEGTDVTLSDIARLCDIFSIGGTKIGALFGEAVVITNPLLKKGFRYMMKRGGAMLAKGWLLGVQFTGLMENDLYLDLGKHADCLALRIRDAFLSNGCPMLIESPTNQQFPILTRSQIERLGRDFAFSPWKTIDENHSAVRFCTSWATSPEDVDKLIGSIETW